MDADWIVWTPTTGFDYDAFPAGVKDATRVDVEFRNGLRYYNEPAQCFGWAHRGVHPETHIVKYRVIKEA